MTPAAMFLIGAVLILLGAAKSLDAWDEHKAETARVRAAECTDFDKAVDQAIALVDSQEPLPEWQRQFLREFLRPRTDELEKARRRRARAGYVE